MSNAKTAPAAEYDLVIAGSGGGSMCAALAAKRMGKSVVILEKQDKVGGSTGFSGGVWWVPNNPLMTREGVPDSLDDARRYFEAVVTYKGPGASPERREAFLKAGPEMVRFLESEGMAFRRPAELWPDYYDDAPGGKPLGRSLMAKNFNVNELGEWKPHLSVYRPSFGIPMGSDEFGKMFLMKRTLGGKLKAMKLALGFMLDKMRGTMHVGSGAAIQGRMLQLALRAGIEIYRNTPVTGLVLDKDRVVGVKIRQADGQAREVRARSGVLVNVGGFSRNAAMRKKYGRKPASSEWTNANPGDTGEVIESMIELGAATDCMDTAWWVVTSKNTNGDWPHGAVHADGTIFPFMHHLDISFPHCIMVDQSGARFCDEAGAYMEIGERMYTRHAETGKCIPAWTIFDSRHRERYNWGNQRPGVTPQEWLDSGYMKKADTLDELAKLCGIDAAGLKSTAARFNRFAANGKDEDFNRGGRAFDLAHGDPTVKPNGSLGAIEEGPFYACAMYPGDVGTAGGVVTDQYARVLREDGTVIGGLYATGNSTASVVGRCYPGAGASIGASFTFAYLATLHSLGSNELDRILA